MMRTAVCVLGHCQLLRTKYQPIVMKHMIWHYIISDLALHPSFLTMSHVTRSVKGERVTEDFNLNFCLQLWVMWCFLIATLFCFTLTYWEAGVLPSSNTWKTNLLLDFHKWESCFLEIIFTIYLQGIEVQRRITKTF